MTTTAYHYRRLLTACARIILLSIAVTCSQQVSAATSVAGQYEANPKYSPLTQIDKTNVAGLELAWEYHTGEVPPEGVANALYAFEDQPSLIEGNLVVCSISRRIIALDPATGEERWTFDPKTPPQEGGSIYQKCRGISHWIDALAAEGAICKSRIFLGTTDYRLVAIDAGTGKPCPHFGAGGVVSMKPSMPLLFSAELVAGSNPAVVNDVVVVSSSVADNQRVNAPSGRVLAFDARNGEQLWQFDPVPRDPADPAAKTWSRGSGEGFGGGNVWSSMAVDEELDLVYLPTTSSSSDFYGGDRVGDNLYTTSVVALAGATGKVAWHYQLVHHNVFDYDIPSHPLLIDYPLDGRLVPALVQNTKMGLIFVFDRRTGEPLIPIEERPVPQRGKVSGEVLSPTQPFPVGMPALVKQGFSPDDASGFTPIDEWLCRREVEKYNYGPMYTPPSEKGTIFSPSSGGGPNWGGGAYDPDSHIMVVPSNRVPTVLTLVPVAEAEVATDDQVIEGGGAMTFPVKESPYVVKVAPLMSPLGAPCSEPPWAGLTAVDIVKRQILWDVPLGDIGKMLSLPFSVEYGTPGAGGALVTAGGLVFIGYTLDDQLRAFDLHSGEVLWQTDLPAAGTSVPVTYEIAGEQYLFVAAGGHSMYGSTLGDSVVAYKLKKTVK
jgi:quinoprotein glucose dehydrogenase